MEKQREPDMQSQMDALKEELRNAELEASRTINNRHARRRLAKMAR